jgi:predicted phosphodiesterase
MRLAVFADVHGNPIALEAVLADIKARGGADQYWVLGDLAAGGHDPAGMLQRLSEIPNARFVRGNTEVSLLDDEPGPWIAQRAARLAGDPAQAHQALREIHAAFMFAWSHGHVAARGWLPWLAQLPVEERLTLPDGVRVTASHAAPGKDGSATGGRVAITPNLTDDDLRPLLAGCAADVALIGHTHYPMDRVVEGVDGGRAVRIINCGSVSNPWAPDLRASYVLIESGASTPHDLQVQHHRVDYDVNAVIDALHSSGHPTADSVAEHFHGKRQPPWLNAQSGT